MKQIFTLMLLSIAIALQAQIDISEARSKSEGALVTVQGVVTTNGEFNDRLRYIQDETGGIAVFSDNVADIILGQEIKVSGALVQYNQLLEIVEVSNIEIINENATLPAPRVLQSLEAGFSENNEGRLVRIDDVSFTEGGDFAAGNSANYQITDGETTKEVRIWSNTNIGGTPIPGDAISLIGVMGQYNETYQLQPRSTNDFIFAIGNPVISTAISQSNITTNSFEVCFGTQNDGTTIVNYTNEAGETKTVTDETLTKQHCVSLTDLQPATIYEIVAESKGETGEETATSSAQYMITESTSSGDMQVYFNQPVNETLATEQAANFVDNGFADLIKNVIANATTSLDIAVYNLDNNNGIIEALSNAKDSGIEIRVIVDSGVSDARVSTLAYFLGDNLKISPASQDATDGIMHNKFIIADVGDADKAVVLAGSTNWTDGQLNEDPNNIIIIQDQALAKVYTKEFNEMFIGDRFGGEKVADTPTHLKIGGKDVEVYFSPSDDTETQIKNVINTTDHGLYIALLAYTRFGISFEIEDLIEERGIASHGIVNDTTSGGFAYSVANETGNWVINQQNNIFHHKYLIVDPNNTASDPTVLTGSHNWSTSAQQRNDENTLIIHDANIANQYYQEFVARFDENSGIISTINDAYELNSSANIYPNPATKLTQLTFATDKFYNYQLSIIDVNGKMAQSQQGKTVNGQNSIALNTANLSKGIYLVQLATNQKVLLHLPLVIAE